MSIKPKLAETALLFCRVTDMPFLPKRNNEPKLAETVLLVSDSTPRIHNEASKDEACPCTLPLVVLGASMASFPGLLHLQFLIACSMCAKIL